MNPTHTSETAPSPTSLPGVASPSVTPGTPPAEAGTARGYLVPHPLDAYGAPPTPGGPYPDSPDDAMLDEYFAQCEEIDTLYEGIEQAEAEIRDANARISTLEPANEALLEQIITRRPEWAAALEDGADPRDES